MIGRYINIMKKKQDRISLLVGVVFVIIAVDFLFTKFGIYAYISYRNNPQEYRIMKGVIVDMQPRENGKYRYWRTIVYCKETDEAYELFGRREDKIGQEVVFGHNESDIGYMNVWLKPYKPKEEQGCILFILFVCFACLLFYYYQMFREANRTKLIYATVLYKKTIQSGKMPEEYAVCIYQDESGKEHLMKTRRMIYPMEVQVKDELLVAVNPKNYKNYQFLEENGEYITRRSEEELEDIAQNLDKYL